MSGIVVKSRSGRKLATQEIWHDTATKSWLSFKHAYVDDEWYSTLHYYR